MSKASASVVQNSEQEQEQGNKYTEQEISSLLQDKLGKNRVLDAVPIYKEATKTFQELSDRTNKILAFLNDNPESAVVLPIDLDDRWAGMVFSKDETGKNAAIVNYVDPVGAAIPKIIVECWQPTITDKIQEVKISKDTKLANSGPWTVYNLLILADNNTNIEGLTNDKKEIRDIRAEQRVTLQNIRKQEAEKTEVNKDDQDIKAEQQQDLPSIEQPAPEAHKAPAVQKLPSRNLLWNILSAGIGILGAFALHAAEVAFGPALAGLITAVVIAPVIDRHIARNIATKEPNLPEKGKVREPEKELGRSKSKEKDDINQPEVGQQVEKLNVASQDNPVPQSLHHISYLDVMKNAFIAQYHKLKGDTNLNIGGTGGLVVPKNPKIEQGQGQRK